MKLSNGPDPGYYDKSKFTDFGPIKLRTINFHKIEPVEAVSKVILFLGTIDSTFMMTTEGFIMFNTDIRWDETLDRFVEFE